jgi:carbonic anhydrase
MKKIYLLFIIMSLINLSTTLATQIDMKKEQAIKGLLKNIFDDNSKFVKEVADQSITNMKNGQEPRATVVMCSDSRIQANVIDNSAVNDLFFIRNIGNQIETAKGSIEFGVRHLHTPVLLIIGHVGCGAIEASHSDYSKESAAIRRELDSLKSSKGANPKQGVIDNINYQVKVALKEFAYEVKDETLLIIGAVYDFKNEYGFGYNRLIVLNVNGEVKPDAIRANHYLKDIEPIKIGVGK